MSRRRVLVAGLLSVLGLPAIACRSKTIPGSASPSVVMSPQANPTLASSGASSGASPATVAPAPDTADEGAWSGEGDPSASPASASGGRDGSAPLAPPDGRVAVDGGLPPAVLARRAVEDEVDRLLQGATDRLVRCFEGRSGRSTEAKLRLRVHRSGYVLEPEVDGADQATRACLAGVVEGLRVTQPLGDSLALERTLRLRREPKR